MWILLKLGSGIVRNLGSYSNAISGVWNEPNLSMDLAQYVRMLVDVPFSKKGGEERKRKALMYRMN